MKVKRYLVNDMNEAMIMIKNELGKDAIILSSRKVKTNGFWGIFGKSKFEVLAAIEDEAQVKSVEAIAKSTDRDKTIIETYRKVKEAAEPAEKSEEMQQFNHELSELKNMVNQLVNLQKTNHDKPHINTKKIEDLSDEKAVTNPGDHLASKIAKGSSELEKLKAYLMDKDLDLEFAEKIAEIMFYEDEAPKDLNSELKDVVQRLLGRPYVIEKTSTKPKVCFFVGPTGVGKTTTLAKLAAKLSLIENKKIGLITSDTYRIAAVDQLKTYSEILGIPLTVIYEPDELPMALSKYSDRDYILIDTAGRSQNSREFESDVAELLEYVEDPEIFLVISLTTGYKEIRKILEAYDFLADFKLLFTKLDESSSLGNVLNARMLTNKSLSYFTIGQSVPDDIEVANPDRIINYIVGE